VVSSIPGQGAVEAAPQMLAQLKADMAANTGPGSTAQAAVPNVNGPVTGPAATPPGVPAPALSPSPSGTAGQQPSASPPGASFQLGVPSTPQAAGASFQVPVTLNGGADVSAVALQLHYDPTKLLLVNVSPGDFLTRDGQPAPPIHSDQPVGKLTVVASRPPGAHGVNGSGVVCFLTFQAKSAGPTDLSVSQATVTNSAQQLVQVASAPASVMVK
jgi:general secretion pathway protein D